MGCIISPQTAAVEGVFNTLTGRFETPRAILTGKHTDPTSILGKIIGCTYERALGHTSSISSLVAIRSGWAFWYTEIWRILPECSRQAGTDNHTEILASRIIAIIGWDPSCSYIRALGHAVSGSWISPLIIGAETDTFSGSVIAKCHGWTGWTI